MQRNSEVIISDTSCLILLFKIDRLDILKAVSDKVYITPTIRQEFGKQLPEWIRSKSPKDDHYQRILELELDSGEASAIALSLEFDNAIIIMDDLKGRKIAERLGLKYSGTFGLILKAKQTGYLPAIKPILNEIRKTDFRFNERLFEMVISLAGE